MDRDGLGCSLSGPDSDSRLPRQWIGVIVPGDLCLLPQEIVPLLLAALALRSQPLDELLVRSQGGFVAAQVRFQRALQLRLELLSPSGQVRDTQTQVCR